MVAHRMHGDLARYRADAAAHDHRCHVQLTPLQPFRGTHVIAVGPRPWCRFRRRVARQRPSDGDLLGDLLAELIEYDRAGEGFVRVYSVIMLASLRSG